MDQIGFNREFLVTSLMPSGNRNSMGLKRVADVDLLVETLIGKGAKDIQVTEVGRDPESYKTWRAKRPESAPKGSPIQALFG